jgi:hypothetical protein
MAVKPDASSSASSVKKPDATVDPIVKPHPSPSPSPSPKAKAPSKKKVIKPLLEN